ncbi:MAG: hypothetical protein HGA65_10315 [Oscillochloris sp.]|nr:hypothetical protein [Oscillochloris sp.]
MLWDGFAPSEGTADDLLPRWTRPVGEVRVRAPHSQPALLKIAAQSCWAMPQPVHLSLYLDGSEILADSVPCPERIYQLLVPPGSSRLELRSPGWQLATAWEDRPSQMGVYLSSLSATVGGKPLPLVGDRLPAERMPRGISAMVVWMGDIRLPLWDYWWTYVPQLELTPTRSLIISGTWASLALICIGVGVVVARTARARRSC